MHLPGRNSRCVIAGVTAPHVVGFESEVLHACRIDEQDVDRLPACRRPTTRERVEPILHTEPFWEANRTGLGYPCRPSVIAAASRERLSWMALKAFTADSPEDAPAVH